jgi:dihydroxyacetone kinase-like predicted kinase
VRTNDPGAALSKALEYGVLSRIHVSNNEERPEHRLHLFEEEELQKIMQDPEADSEEEEAAEAAVSMMAHKDVGFIAVSTGDGLGSIFRELGADCLIEGGQTMNPSTQDILTAIEKVNADTVFILPNNKNIILAAEQAQNLTHEKKIVVIPTRTIPQGIAALVNYMPEKTPAENEAAMREEIYGVKTVELTYAVRDTKIEDKTIHSGDIMGVGDNGIIAVGTDIEETAMDSLTHMIEDDSELISVYYGKEISQEDADRLADRIREKFPDCEVEVNPGGQPIYYYILSVE